MLLYLGLTVLYDCKENNVIKWGIPVVAVPPNQKKKNLVNFVLSMYRTTIWSTRSWRKKGQAVNPRHIFRSLIKKRIALEFQTHKQTDSIDTFFDIFGINEALIYSTPRDYNIAFY